MTRLSILSLGALHLTLDDVPLTGFDSDKARALLAFLAIESHRAHRRERLTGLLWPEYPERRARHTLSQVLSNVRQVIGDRNPDRATLFLDVTPQAIRFNCASDYWLDVEMFSTLPPHELPDAQHSIACCEQAIAVYRGHFLEGLSIGDSPAFEEWVLTQRERWLRVALETLTRLIEGYTHLGDYDRALHYAWRQLDLDPWREDTHRRVMRLLALSGQRSAALAQYDTCRRTLLAELDAEPERETRLLYQAIKAGRIAPLRPHATPPQPDDMFIPLHNLPAPLTPLIGREADLALLKTRLQEPDCRLFTLVGPGGIGKTRLALEVAASLVAAFAHGVFFVSLAPLQSAQAIAPAIAQALGLTFSDKGGTQEQQLLAYLKNKKMLLILDNVEHLLRELDTEGGKESATIARTITTFLEAAPGVRILVTSRIRLNILGEHLFPVGELAYPQYPVARLADVQDLAAVQLFVQSARRQRSNFALTENNIQAVSDICRYVQGIPLAILLAATWTTTCSTAQIATMLTDASAPQSHSLDLLEADWQNVPPAQRSLRAVFEHSWRLLSAHEQEVCGALSVFSGGFTSAAAHAIAGATSRDLQALVNASLLYRASSGRCTMHTLLRQYTEEKLAQSSLLYQEVNDRHSEYYVTALQRWGDDLLGAQQLIALTELDAEIDNVRAAWYRAGARPNVLWLQQGCDGLGRYLRRRAYHAEGAILFQTNLDRLNVDLAEQFPAVLARLLTWAGIFNQMGGNFPQAVEYLHRALALYGSPSVTAPADRLGKALALLELAHLIRPADPQRAIAMGQESIALYRAHHAQAELAEALYVVGEILGYAGHIATAIHYQEECLRIRREVQDYGGIADSLRLISYVATNLGDLQKAEQLARESCQIREDIGDLPGAVVSLYTLGTALFGLGRFAESIDILLRSVRLSSQLGWRDSLIEPVIHLSLAYALAGKFDSAQHYIESILNVPAAEQNPRRTGYAFFVLGLLCVGKREYTDAQKWFEKSIDLFHTHAGGGEVEMARTWLVIALWMLALRREAREQLINILAAYVRQNIAPFSVRISTLPAIALVCIGIGEHEKALEVYAFARTFPMLANIPWLDTIFREPLARAAAALSPDVIAAAQKRGHARDLQETITEFLALFNDVPGENE